MKTSIYTILLVLIPLISFSQEKIFTVKNVLFNLPNDRLYGYADLRMKAVCGGEPRIMVAVDKVVITGFTPPGGYNNEQNKQYEYEFPIEAISGNIYLKGSLPMMIPGTNTYYNHAVAKTNISMGLQGFLDWIVMEDEKFQEMSCEEWKSYFATNFTGNTSLLYVVDENCLSINRKESCFYNSLVNSHQDIEKAIAKLDDYSKKHLDLSNSSATTSDFKALLASVTSYNWPSKWENQDELENLKYSINRSIKEADAKKNKSSSNKTASLSKSSPDNYKEEKKEEKEEQHWDDSDAAIAARAEARKRRLLQTSQTAERHGDYRTAYKALKEVNRTARLNERDMQREARLGFQANLQGIFEIALEESKKEREEDMRKWRERIEQEKGRIKELKAEYWEEFRKAKLQALGQNNISYFIMEGGDIASQSPQQVREIFNTETKRVGNTYENSPFSIYALLEETENSNSLNDSIYLFNYYENLPSSVIEIQLSAAKKSFKSQVSNNHYGSAKKALDEMGKYKPQIGVSEIVGISQKDFKRIPEKDLNKKYKTTISKYFSSTSDVKKEDYWLFGSKDKIELIKLREALGFIYGAGIEKIKTPTPINNVKEIQNNISRTNNLRSMEPDRGPVLNDRRNGESYETVYIGDQLWMAENMRIRIGNYYLDNSEYSDQYRNYYYTPTTAGSVCPDGWRLPSKQDVEDLALYVENKVGISFKQTDDFKSSLNRNFGFNVKNTGYKKLDFLKRKWDSKLEEWHNKRWLNSNEDLINENLKLEDVGFRDIPTKFFRKASKSYSMYKTLRTDMSWFWVNNVEIKDGKLKSYVMGIGSDDYYVFYNKTPLLFPCRCIKE